MTSGDHEFEARLRQALHSAAEVVEPAGDGLARIRAKLDRPWLQRQASLLAAETSRLAAVAAGAWAELPGTLRSWAGLPGAPHSRPGAVSHRPGSGTGPRHRGAQPRHGHAHPRAGRVWLRPGIVIGGAAAVLAMGIYAISPLSPVAGITGQTIGAFGSGQHGGGGPNAAGSSRDHLQHPGGTARPGNGHHPSPSKAGPERTPSPSCSPTPQPSGLPSASATPTGSPTPTPTGSPTPTPTGSPTPTPTPTATVPSIPGLVTSVVDGRSGNENSVPMCGPAPSPTPTATTTATPQTTGLGNSGAGETPRRHTVSHSPLRTVAAHSRAGHPRDPGRHRATAGHRRCR
jgi:hypothetical protein